MNTPIQVNELLEKPMDRREFLKNVGIAGLFVMGGGTIVRSIVDFIYQQKQPRQVAIAKTSAKVTEQIELMQKEALADAEKAAEAVQTASAANDDKVDSAE